MKLGTFGLAAQMGGLGYASTFASAAPGAVVVMNEHAFDPPEVTIRVGQSVLWRNDDCPDHTVTADPKIPAGAAPFHSGCMRSGETFEQVFAVAGTYKYFCRPHEAQMTGIVHVVSQEPTLTRGAR